MPDEAGQYDLVILSHALEHLRDLKPALAEDLEGFLTGRARCYAEVPDAPRYADFAWSPFQDFNTEHINHFSLALLRNLVAASGFRGEPACLKKFCLPRVMPYPAIFCLGPPMSVVRAHGQGPRPARGPAGVYPCVGAADEGHRCAIAEKAVNGMPVIVWGTGELTAKLLVDTELARAKSWRSSTAIPSTRGAISRACRLAPPTRPPAQGRDLVVASILHAPRFPGAIRRSRSAEPRPRTAEPSLPASTRDRRYHISVLTPCYNEAGNVRAAVRARAAVFGR